MKSNSLGRKLSLALVLAGTLVFGLALVSRPVSCIDREVEKLIADERRMLDKDAKLFNSFATDLALVKTSVFSVRRRRAHNDLLALEQSRRAAISDFLDSVSKSNMGIGEFKRKLADVHASSADRLPTLLADIRHACENLENPKYISLMLEGYLDGRLDSIIYDYSEFEGCSGQHFNDRRVNPWLIDRPLSLDELSDSYVNYYMKSN
jgi:hypothetical protein